MGHSIFQLFYHADAVIKGVVILLLLASLWSWAFMLYRWMSFVVLRRSFSRFEKLFWHETSIDNLYESLRMQEELPGVLERIFLRCMREWKEGQPFSLAALMERVDRIMNMAVDRLTSRLESRLFMLATLGATAPFVGLFGTVWGIMNSFRSIASAHNTNLSVVAPGIAEALAATAIGLLVAIPAVIGYNVISRACARYEMRVQAFCDALQLALLRRFPQNSAPSAFEAREMHETSLEAHESDI